MAQQQMDLVSLVAVMLRRFKGWLEANMPFATTSSVTAPSAGQLPPSFKSYLQYIRVDPTAIIAPTASLKIFNVPSPPRICLDIGPNCHVFSNFAILHPDAQIVIGPRCQLGASSLVAREKITFEGDTLLAWGATLMDTDAHSIYWAEREGDVERSLRDYLETGGWDLARTHDWRTVATAPITVGAKTWIGFNSSILKGVHIGEGCVIGAGSIVTKNIPAWHLAAGNPCRPIRELAVKRTLP